MQRVLVVGTSGSGKTTVAGTLARRLGVPHVELDALFWESGWEPADPVVFRERVAAQTEGDGWVVCGNYYSATCDITWPRADTVVWLDFPRHVVVRRVVVRTARRIVSRDPLWNGNRETVRNALTARDSIIWWSWTSHPRNRERFSEMIADPAFAHLRWYRLRTRSAVRRLLNGSFT